MNLITVKTEEEEFTIDIPVTPENHVVHKYAKILEELIADFEKNEFKYNIIRFLIGLGGLHYN